MQYVNFDGTVATVRVAGKYTLVNTQDVIKQLESVFRNGCTKVCVDLSETTYIDSSVVRDCSKLYYKLGETVDNFWFVGPQGRVRAALIGMGLGKLIKE